MEYVNAANILKNLMIVDFASIRHHDVNIALHLKENLLLIIKTMATENIRGRQLELLCMALAILVIHMNENQPKFIEDIIRELLENVEHATCLFMILKHMA
jgi:hypothetical protein